MTIETKFDIRLTQTAYRSLTSQEKNQYVPAQHTLNISEEAQAAPLQIISRDNYFYLVTPQLTYYRIFHNSTQVRTTLMAVLFAHKTFESQKQFVFEVDPSIVDTMAHLQNYDYMDTYDLLQDICKFKSTMRFIPFQQPHDPEILHLKPFYDLFYENIVQLYEQLPAFEKYVKNTLQYYIQNSNNTLNEENNLIFQKMDKRSQVSVSFFVHEDLVVYRGMTIQILGSDPATNALLFVLLSLKIYECDANFLIVSEGELEFESDENAALVRLINHEQRGVTIKQERKTIETTLMTLKMSNLPPLAPVTYNQLLNFMVKLDSVVPTVRTEQEDVELMPKRVMNIRAVPQRKPTMNFSVFAGENYFMFERNKIRYQYHVLKSSRLRMTLMCIVMILHQFQFGSHYIFSVDSTTYNQMQKVQPTGFDLIDLILGMADKRGFSYNIVSCDNRESTINRAKVFDHEVVYRDLYYEQHCQTAESIFLAKQQELSRLLKTKDLTVSGRHESSGRTSESKAKLNTPVAKETKEKEQNLEKTGKSIENSKEVKNLEQKTKETKLTEIQKENVKETQKEVKEKDPKKLIQTGLTFGDLSSQSSNSESSSESAESPPKRQKQPQKRKPQRNLKEIPKIQKENEEIEVKTQKVELELEKIGPGFNLKMRCDFGEVPLSQLTEMLERIQKIAMLK